MIHQELPQEWDDLISNLVKASQATAYGVFEASGELIYANSTMYYFLGSNSETSKAKNKFINPGFDKIVDAKSASELIFEGVLTIGNSFDTSYSFKAKIFRKRNTFLVFAEVDAVQLFEENQRMSQLDQQVNNLQRQSIKEKKKLDELTKQLYNHQNNLESIIKERTSELEKAKCKAEESDRLKSAFIANMSHEIRTPLNGIIGFSHLLSELTNDPAQQNYLNTIQLNSTRLLRLVSDILDLSELEATNTAINKVLVNSSVFFDEIIQSFKSQIELSDLEFFLIVPHSFPAKMLIDASKLSAIISNLLSNAIKFTPKGYVKLYVEEVPNQSKHSNVIDLKLTVEDTGIGLEKENYQKIFQPFFQLDDQSNREFEGTGIGLTLCKRLTMLMDGTIEVKSELGNGTTFIVTIPNVEVIVANQLNANSSVVENEIKRFVNPDTNQLISSDGNDGELEPNDETTISQEDRQQLINELTGNLMLRWEKFAAIQSMKKVRDFASDINDLALKYNYRPLKEMAHKLSQAVDSFDIIEMNQTLKKYPDLVLKMQNNDSNA